MNDPISETDPLVLELKQIIADQFGFPGAKTAPLATHEPLIYGRLGLDSLDALELGLSVEEKFGVRVTSAAEARQVFSSVATLAEFIRHEAPARHEAASRTDVQSSGRVRPHRHLDPSTA
jgi:acyl carrier protein